MQKKEESKKEKEEKMKLEKRVNEPYQKKKANLFYNLIELQKYEIIEAFKDMIKIISIGVISAITFGDPIKGEPLINKMNEYFNKKRK